MNWSAISLVAGTDAYFNDEEKSENNIMEAGVLDFRLTNQNVSGFVGMENNGEIFHTSVAIPESGSMPMQYFVYSTSTSPVCSEFRVRVKQNETEIFYGFLPDFLSAATTVFGTWKFEFDLPIGASVTQGDLCQADITFSAWREEIENPEESGFFDTETLSLNLKAKTIVLNEILAHPNPEYPYPASREFIELKNNGNASVDVAGWKVSEMTDGGVENKYTITTAGGSYTASPYGGSTIIPAGGWLVLLLSDATALNDGGDTVRLYDSGDNKLDEYPYKSAKYGLSDARYLDGIGDWVDPIPTPGWTNEVGENLKIAGSGDLIGGASGGHVEDEDNTGDEEEYGDDAEDGGVTDGDKDDDKHTAEGDSANGDGDTATATDGTDDTDVVDTDTIIPDGASGSTAFQDYGASDSGAADIDEGDDDDAKTDTNDTNDTDVVNDTDVGYTGDTATATDGAADIDDTDGNITGGDTDATSGVTVDADDGADADDGGDTQTDTQDADDGEYADDGDANTGDEKETGKETGKETKPEVSVDETTESAPEDGTGGGENGD